MPYDLPKRQYTPQEIEEMEREVAENHAAARQEIRDFVRQADAALANAEHLARQLGRDEDLSVAESVTFTNAAAQARVGLAAMGHIARSVT